ncbi:MAG: hypothetical protein A2020_07300 [Lentisphaerae bacterium GWF2_45_14]|nr:MAG: hypothetical protein A2020_07300 [Lentisphaerae bacterium GWF2_45_14]
MIKDVSVIIPIYNEAYGVERAVRSAVHQCEHLYIGDNASTDGSSEICMRLAKEFPEIISYTRHPKNMGSRYNGSIFLLSQVKTPYFMYLGGHDYISSDYVAKLKELLDNNPDAVLAGGKCIGVFRDGKHPVSYIAPDMKPMSSESTFTRVNHIASGHCAGTFEGFIQYGLQRTEIYRMVCSRPYPLAGSDMIGLMRQAEAGKFLINDEVFFYYEHDVVYSRQESYYRLNAKNVDDKNFSEIVSRMTKCMYLHIVRSVRFYTLPILIKMVITRYQLTKMYAGFKLRRHDWTGFLCNIIIFLKKNLPTMHSGDDFLLARRLNCLWGKGILKNKKIALYGAGLHSRRLLATQIIPADSIVAIFDDKPTVDVIEGVPVLHVSQSRSLKYDIILISSDTVEKVLYRQAKLWAPEGVKILRLYFWKLGLSNFITGFRMQKGDDNLQKQLLWKLMQKKSVKNKKIALYGAGAHTSRLMDKHIIPVESIVAIFDDNPKSDSINGIPLLSTSQAESIKYDALLVSSDTIEGVLYKKAKSWVPRGVSILTLYSWRLWFIQRNDLKIKSVEPSFPAPGKEHFLSHILSDLVSRGFGEGKKIAIYGTGLHSTWILRSRIFPDGAFVAVFDDNPRVDNTDNVPVFPIEDVMEKHFDFLIINTNSKEEEADLYRKAVAWNLPENSIIRIYS